MLNAHILHASKDQLSVLRLDDTIKPIGNRAFTCVSGSGSGGGRHRLRTALAKYHQNFHDGIRATSAPGLDTIERSNSELRLEGREEKKCSKIQWRASMVWERKSTAKRCWLTRTRTEIARPILGLRARLYVAERGDKFLLSS